MLKLGLDGAVQINDCVFSSKVQVILGGLCLKPDGCEFQGASAAAISQHISVVVTAAYLYG